MQITVRHRRAQFFGQRFARLDAAGRKHDSAAGDDNRRFRRRQKPRRFVQRALAAGPAIDHLRRRDAGVEFAVKIIARNV